MTRLDPEDRAPGHCNPDDHEPDDGLVLVESFRSQLDMPPGEKWRDRPRSNGLVTTVVVHQTAVLGGFGVRSQLLDRHGGDALAARQARYRDTPYHGLFSPQDRASIVQWPAWAYTFHGNGANRYSVGWAYDGLLPGDELDVDGARASMTHFVETVRESGVRLRYVEAHRQHSAQRGGDPGVEIWTRVVLPLLEQLELEQLPWHVTGTGKRIPPAWLA